MYWFGLFLLFGLASARHEAYDGHTLYKVTVQDVDQIRTLNDLLMELNLDVWAYAVPGRDGAVLVPRDERQLFQNELYAAGIKYKVEVENIKDMLELEDRLMAKASRKTFARNATAGLPFDTIYTYAEVDAYLEELAVAYPDVVTLVNAGKSFEGRDIKYLKISSTNFEDTRKPIVFMESLLHAREWVTLPATLYAIHKLVIDVSDPELVNDIDWIILPIANPDGYEHSHNDFRFWRKNRSTGHIIGDVCVGVDLNRNFDIDWSLASSQLACSEVFHGPSPFSEPESAIVRDILLEYGDRIELFLDIHSFGSMILFGYGSGQLPPNALTLNLVGVRMAQAIDAVKMSWNPNYIVGNVALVLYQASGGAGDYAQAIGVPLSYTFELPSYRFGLGTIFGFLVDPDFIEQAGMETWEGIKVGARFVLDNFGRNGKGKYEAMNFN